MSTKTIIKTSIALTLLALFLPASLAQAFPNTGADFAAMYPTSQTVNNASCASCHVNSFGGRPWNAYGIALKLSGVDFAAVEGLDSDGDGFSNLFEILANTQPGWCDPVVTPGCDNRGFDGSGIDVGAATPPIGVQLDPDVQAPEIDLDALALDFGSVTVGTAATLSTTIFNLGAADLTVTGLTLGGSTDFTLGAAVPFPPFVVPMGGSLAVAIDYAPSDVGGDAGTLDIESDDADEPVVMVSLDGNGVPPVGVCDIDVIDLVLDFAGVEVGSSASLSTTIGNTGNADCMVSRLSLSGSFDFTLGAGAPATPFTVAPLAIVVVPLDYTPSAVGDDSGMLSIESDDIDEPAVGVVLAGSGFTQADIDVSPPAIDFGTVSVSSAAVRTATISNLGSLDLTVTSLAIGGSTDFALGAAAPLPPFNVPPGGSLDVPVTYAPSLEGSANAMLDVGSDDVDEPNVAVLLSGVGVPGAGVCDIDVNPLAIAFGDIVVGTTEHLQTTIGNTGDAECVVSQLSLAGSPDFALGVGAPATACALMPAASVQVTVDYTPSDIGSVAATLSVSSDDPDEAQIDVPVTGAGLQIPIADIDVDPLLLDFGTVTLGGGVNLTATVSNFGSADLTVTSLGLSGSTNFDFGAAAPLTPFTVPPAGSVEVPVDYTPTDVGSDAGSLDIASDDPDEPNVTIALSGVTVAPAGVCDIDVDPLALDFGSVEVGTIATLSIRVGNSGDADCLVSQLDLSGSADLALGAGVPATPFVLAPMTAANVPVDYAPSGIGADNAALTVGSDDPDQPSVAVSVAGAGTMTPEPPTGKQLYDNNCGFCHGDFDAAPTLAPQKVLGARSCTINGAVNGTSVFPGGVPEMQFLQGLLSQSEIGLITGYLNSQPVTGEERFVTACAGCHGLDGSGGRTGENVRGEDAVETAKAINDKSEMIFLACLPNSEIAAIGAYLETLNEHEDSYARGSLSFASGAQSREAALLQQALVSGLPLCVPEPASGLLAAAAFATLAALRLRRR